MVLLCAARLWRTPLAGGTPAQLHPPQQGRASTAVPPAPPRPCPRSFLPHIGRVTIIMNDYPMFKYALIAVLAVFVLTSKE